MFALPLTSTWQPWKQGLSRNAHTSSRLPARLGLGIRSDNNIFTKKPDYRYGVIPPEFGMFFE